MCRDECVELKMKILDPNSDSIPHPEYSDKETFPIKNFNLQIILHAWPLVNQISLLRI